MMVRTILMVMMMLVLMARMVMMSVVVGVPVGVVMKEALRAVEVSQHPISKNQHDDSRNQVQVRRKLGPRPNEAAIGGGPGQDPYHRRVGECGTEREHDRLGVRSAGSDDERRHDSLGMARLQSVQCAQDQRYSQEEKRMTADVLREINRIHDVQRYRQLSRLRANMVSVLFRLPRNRRNHALPKAQQS